MFAHWPLWLSLLLPANLLAVCLSVSLHCFRESLSQTLERGKSIRGEGAKEQLPPVECRVGRSWRSIVARPAVGLNAASSSLCRTHSQGRAVQLHFCLGHGSGAPKCPCQFPTCLLIESQNGRLIAPLPPFPFPLPLPGPARFPFLFSSCLEFGHLFTERVTEGLQLTVLLSTGAHRKPAHELAESANCSLAKHCPARKHSQHQASQNSIRFDSTGESTCYLEPFLRPIFLPNVLRLTWHHFY